jgi:hypothetical protein
MADTLSAKDLAELRQLYKDLQGISIPNMSDFVKSIGGMEAARKNLEQMRKEFNNINSDITYLVGHLKDATREVSNQNNAIKDTRKSYNSLSSIASKLKYDQDGISRLNKKDLDSISKKVVQEKQNLEAARKTNIERARFLKEQLKNNASLDQATREKYATEKKSIEGVITESDSFLTDTVNGYILLEGAINKRIEKEKLANKVLGISGAIVNSIASTMGKLGLGGLVNLESIKEKMQEVADAAADKAQAEGRSVAFGDKLKVLGIGISESFKSIGESLKDPIVAFKILYDLANKADQQTTQLAKSLMQTKFEAMQTREEFVGMANAAGDAFINTDKLIEANAALGKQLGFNKVFSQDMNQTFVDLTKKIGLSEEAAGGLAKISIATGKTLKSTEQTIAGITSKISAQNGIQLDGKEILEESGKISGQLLANFKGNPAAIAEAVAQTKVLGTTLEQTKNQASKLLDFESSIGSQLKAELLTGQQLNLERARAAALQGNQVTVAKELVNQNINFNKFSKMNVIQQNALAESLGLSSDQLSDQLLKQAAIGKSRSEIVALNGEEAAKRLEALAAQDKFNAAVEKLKDLFGNLVGGPLGTILDVLSDAVGLVGKLISGIQSILGNTLMKGVLGAAAGFAVGGPMGALIGGVAGLASGVMSSADDMVGYGARTLTTPTGTVALNNNDTVIAGTNLFKGDDVMSFPKGKLNLGGSDNGKLEELMSTLIDVTKSTKIGVNLDGRAVGTGIVRATYQSA